MSYLAGLAWALPELLAPAPLSAASEMRTVFSKKLVNFGVKVMFYPWRGTSHSSDKSGHSGQSNKIFPSRPDTQHGEN